MSKVNAQWNYIQIDGMARTVSHKTSVTMPYVCDLELLRLELRKRLYRRPEHVYVEFPGLSEFPRGSSFPVEFVYADDNDDGLDPNKVVNIIIDTLTEIANDIKCAIRDVELLRIVGEETPCDDELPF